MATAQSQLGHYRITARLGIGGMGEVWRATDTKLNREVAIKMLPADFAGDPARLARFKREAQVLASLNHPGIAAIYGIEESGEGGVPGLVMELVEGPTLAERIRAGVGASAKSLPADEALPIAKQIAEALEYAHERGVIHRDLKPANVKVRPEGTVKVLDFGLAKVMSDEDSTPQMVSPDSPTLSAMATQAGIILGTAAYMAPEQAKGKPVDRRADIWAFGCVLFEMLAGKRAFDGETISDVLAEVIRGEPDWTALPATTPASIQRLIRRCLQKEPRQRLQAIGDARIAIEETMADPTLSSVAQTEGRGYRAEKTTRLRRVLPWALGGIAAILAAALAWEMLKPAPQQGAARFTLSPPENAQFVPGGLSLSPDGRSLAFAAEGGQDKSTTLWLRPLDSVTAHAVPGTEGAAFPFWSPDSQQIGFETGGKLQKLPLSGGTPQTLCDASGFSGATWNRDGVILFSSLGSLYRVPDTGGTPALVLAPDASRHETGLAFPQFLPDGSHFVFEANTNESDAHAIEAASLDSKAVERLAPSDAQAFFAAPGYLFYTDHRTLVARRFNPGALRFTGPALPVAQNIGKAAYADYTYFSVSPAGVLAYQDVAFGRTNQATWFSRAGEALGTVGRIDIYTAPALSPDGLRFAVAVGDFGKRDIWIYDLKRGTASRLTFGPQDNTNTAWSPDGTRIVFSSNQTGQYEIYQKAANGLGAVQPLFQYPGQNKHLDDLSSDGRYAVYDTAADHTGIWMAPLFGDRKPFPFVQGNFTPVSAVFSPNNRYVAYATNESGNYEVYVQTFPQQTGKWQISTAGGLQPMWSANGKELFYLADDGKLTAVDVNTAAPTFQAGIPRPLFQTQLDPAYRGRNYYVVSPDGQRFLVLAPVATTPEPITVVVNWPALLQPDAGK